MISKKNERQPLCAKQPVTWSITDLILNLEAYLWGSISHHRASSAPSSTPCFPQLHSHKLLIWQPCSSIQMNVICPLCFFPFSSAAISHHQWTCAVTYLKDFVQNSSDFCSALTCAPNMVATLQAFCVELLNTSCYAVTAQCCWSVWQPRGRTVKLVECRTVLKIQKQYWYRFEVLGAVWDCSPRVNFQCRPSYSVCTVLVCHHMHQHLCACQKSQTLTAIPLFGHIKILHTLGEMDNFWQGVNKYFKSTTTKTHLCLRLSAKSFISFNHRWPSISVGTRY